MAAGCGKRPAPQSLSDNMPISHSKNAPGDSTIYGLTCPGGSDSVIVLLPNAGGNPISFNIINARKNGMIFGTPTTGHWVGIITESKKSRVARLVVDLDEIKGTWTYRVMPHLRDVSHLSKAQQDRIIANMPDSIVDTYMIPRQYGFTLKRQSEVLPVGNVFGASNIDDDSPVEYPPVPTFREWHAYNGHILLAKGIRNKEGMLDKNPKAKPDTCDLVYMRDDSLVLRVKGNLISFKRQANSHTANAKANAAAKKQAEKAQENLKQ